MTQLDAAQGTVEVRGYRLPLDRCYDTETHMWLKVNDGGTVRVGIDSLGVETNGTLAQLSFVATGTEVKRGQAFGQLEAAKFVGPLQCPVSGTVVAVNEEALSAPAVVEHDPFGAGWLIDIAPCCAGDELPELLAEPQAIVEWFTAKVDEYRLKGVIAE